MTDYIEIGPTPCDEDCQQVGTAGYDPIAARAECERFRELIRKTLGQEPEGAKLIIKANAHDFGTYHEVACKYDDSYPDAVAYALRCESEAPATWK